MDGRTVDTVCGEGSGEEGRDSHVTMLTRACFTCPLFNVFGSAGSREGFLRLMCCEPVASRIVCF